MPKGGGPVVAGDKTRAENTAKVARRRRNAHAAAATRPIPKGQEDWLLPVRDINELVDDDTPLTHVGSVLGGIGEFKILRGAVGQMTVTTSPEYAHVLTDAAITAKSEVLVIDIYLVDRARVFDVLEDADEDGDGDADGDGDGDGDDA